MNILRTYHHAGRHYAHVDVDGHRVEFAFDKKPTEADISESARSYQERAAKTVDLVDPHEEELERVKAERDYYKAKVEELEKEAEK